MERSLILPLWLYPSLPMCLSALEVRLTQPEPIIPFGLTFQPNNKYSVSLLQFILCVTTTSIFQVDNFPARLFGQLHFRKVQPTCAAIRIPSQIICIRVLVAMLRPLRICRRFEKFAAHFISISSRALWNFFRFARIFRGARAADRRACLRRSRLWIENK